MSREIWDISQTLGPRLPVWPGDTPFSHRRRWVIDDGSPVNVSSFETTGHAGAHADAPLHYRHGADSVGDLDLAPYLGPCLVVDARSAGPLLLRRFVEANTASPPPRIVFRTFERFPHDAWPASFTAVEPATIEFLAARGVILIGIDSPSVDPPQSKTMDAHMALLAADMRVLEGLVLDDVPAGPYELVALPLKLAGLDASPVRAVLRRLAT